MRKKPTLKYSGRIDPKETTYFHFKLDASTYALYDSELGNPVIFGSFNLVGATISNLSPKCTIFYFELDGRQGWKMKRSYKPDKTTAEIEDKTSKIQDKKEEKQEDKEKARQ